MTVEENVAFPLEEHTKKSKEEIAKIVENTLGWSVFPKRGKKCPRSYPADNANASPWREPSPWSRGSSSR